MTVTLIVGHALDRLRAIPERSVQCVVTSPPYWGLRDYGAPPIIWGGKPGCAHDFQMEEVSGELRTGLGMAALSEGHRGGGHKAGKVPRIAAERGSCRICGAWRGAFGLEPTYQLYVEHAVAIFREVRRVLRDDGVLWLNLGDSYISAPSGPDLSASKLEGSLRNHSADRAVRRGATTERLANGRGDEPAVQRMKTRATRDGTHDGKHTAMAAMGPMTQPNRIPQPDLKMKDLAGIPWRVAFALQADGWWLRQDIIWSKPNPMPESVTDRCTKAHEYLFLLSKSERYCFDHSAIREPFADASIERLRQDIANQGSDRVPGKTNGPMKAVGLNANRASYRPGSASNMNGSEHVAKSDAGLPLNEAGRNKRSVWTIATMAFAAEFCRACQTYFEGADLRALRVEAIKHDGDRVERRRHCRCGAHDRWLSHFATFPPDLVEPCVKAGCPAGGAVLDPFAGAGTTGLVADRLGRNAVLIELNPEYASMIEQRLNRDGGLFGPVESTPLTAGAGQ